MRTFILALSILTLNAPLAFGSEEAALSGEGTMGEEQEVLDLSRQKWLWMAERDIDALENLFHEEAMFVHMGGNMTRSQELEVIRTGGIHYKHAEIFEASVRFVGSTAIVLNRIRLDAVVGGNEVTNPFTVSEVYVMEGGARKLALLAFTRLLTP